MELYGYSAFSLSCEMRLCEIAELLIAKHCDTSVLNHLGMTGCDIVHKQAKLAPESGEWQRMKAVLDDWTHKQESKKLKLEEQRNLSRPVQDVQRERAEVDFGRLGYWERDPADPTAQFRYFKPLAKGAFGEVAGMPVFPPFLDTSGKLHHSVVAKATLTKVDASSASDGAAGSRSGIAAATEAEVKALSNEIQTLHKLDREP